LKADTISPIDPNDLAALLDGTLPAAEREQILARLANDPQALAAVADSAEVLAELEFAGSSTEVAGRPSEGEATPVEAQRTIPGKWWLGLAATLALATLLGQILLSQRTVSPDRLARALAGTGDLPALEVIPRLRSAGPADPRVEPSSEFFLGALCLRVAVGIEEGDSAVSAASARDIQALLPAAVDLPQALQALYGGLADDLAGGVAAEALESDARRAREQVLATLGPSRRRGFDLGMLVEAARLASSRDAIGRLPRQVADGLERISRTVDHPRLAQDLRGLSSAVHAEDPRVFGLAAEVQELCRRNVECLPRE
jgi:hypothetical protein